MKKIVSITSIFLSLGLLCAVGGCTLNIPNPNLSSDPNAITNASTARSLLADAYASYPHYEYELSILGNDFTPTNLTGKDVSIQNLYRWQDNALTNLAERMWVGYYHTATLCDVLLERAPKIATPTAEEEKDKEAIILEGKVLKAMCYFQLLRLFAPAFDQNPQGEGIVLKSRIGVEEKKRDSKEACVAQIRSWLAEATAQNYQPQQNGWLSSMAAHYLLAEVELYAGNYEAVIEHASKVIDLNASNLLSDEQFEFIWGKVSSPYRIFAFYTTDKYYTNIQYDENEGDFFAIAPALSFADTDSRKPLYTYSKEMDGQTRTLLGKYNANNKDGRGNTYIDMMRPAGLYLIATEAYAHIPGKEATCLQMLNCFRAWHHLPALQGLQGEKLIQAILEEKYREFVGEGRNIFDLKRTHKNQLKRTGAWGKGTQGEISPEDYRWTLPIPASEYKYNKSINQNRGWPINR